MATTNIFAGSITCDGFTNAGSTTVSGAITTSTGFIGPALLSASVTGVGVAGNTLSVSASSGTNGVATGGAGGNLLLSAASGGNGVAGGAGGTVLIDAGDAGTGNGNGGEIILAPGGSTGSGVYGSVSVAGPLRSPTGGAAIQAIADNGTITLPVAGFNKKVATSSAANKTGVILAAGIADGQTICIINTTAANTITFAASGTSRVADGVSAVIPALRAMIFTWDATSALWYRQGA